MSTVVFKIKRIQRVPKDDWWGQEQTSGAREGS